MSAYICDNELISIIIGFIQQLPPRDQRSYYRFDGETLTWPEIDELGQILLDENVRSVDYHYKETNEKETFVYTTPPRRVTALEALQAIATLDYQSCETPDWEETRAYILLEGVKSMAIRALPGYDKAGETVRNLKSEMRIKNLEGQDTVYNCICGETFPAKFDSKGTCPGCKTEYKFLANGDAQAIDRPATEKSALDDYLERTKEPPTIYRVNWACVRAGLYHLEINDKLIVIEKVMKSDGFAYNEWHCGTEDDPHADQYETLQDAVRHCIAAETNEEFVFPPRTSIKRMMNRLIKDRLSKQEEIETRANLIEAVQNGTIQVEKSQEHQDTPGIDKFRKSIKVERIRKGLYRVAGKHTIRKEMQYTWKAMINIHADMTEKREDRFFGTYKEAREWVINWMTTHELGDKAYTCPQCGKVTISTDYLINPDMCNDCANIRLKDRHFGEVEYRGYALHYNKEESCWACTLPNGRTSLITYPTLTLARKGIDLLIEAEEEDARNGYRCPKCNKYNKFTTWVYAHSQEKIEHRCDCGAVNTLLEYKVIDTQDNDDPPPAPPASSDKPRDKERDTDPRKEYREYLYKMMVVRFESASNYIVNHGLSLKAAREAVEAELREMEAMARAWFAECQESGLAAEGSAS